MPHRPRFHRTANKKYDFELKFTALLNKAHGSLADEIKRGFISVPRGCYIHLRKRQPKTSLEISTYLLAHRADSSRELVPLKKTAEDRSPWTNFLFLLQTEQNPNAFYPRVTGERAANQNYIGSTLYEVDADYLRRPVDQ